MFDDNRIVLIKKVINQHLPQSKIYLFGSYAKNTKTKESDFGVNITHPRDFYNPSNSETEEYVSNNQNLRN